MTEETQNVNTEPTNEEAVTETPKKKFDPKQFAKRMILPVIGLAGVAIALALANHESRLDELENSDEYFESDESSDSDDLTFDLTFDADTDGN